MSQRSDRRISSPDPTPPFESTEYIVPGGRLWRAMNWIAATALTAPPAVWGGITLARGEFYVPDCRSIAGRNWYIAPLEGTPATLCSCSIFLAAAAVFSHAALSEFDSLPPWVDRAKRACAYLALVAFSAGYFLSFVSL